MRLKYYLRGLGIGIAVTAVVLSLSTEHKAAALTDEQIIERAKALGMQEAEPDDAVKTLSNRKWQTDAEENQTQPADTDADTQPEQPADTDSETQPGEPEGTDTEAQPEQSGDTDAEAQQEQPGDTDTEAQPGEPEGADTEAQLEQPEGAESEAQPDENVVSKVRITIQSGESSVSVSRKVAEAGLTDSAAAFDRFLCQNGYDKRLVVGAHEIAEGASEREIAEALTSR